MPCVVKHGTVTNDVGCNSLIRVDEYLVLSHSSITICKIIWNLDNNTARKSEYSLATAHAHQI